MSSFRSGASAITLPPDDDLRVSQRTRHRDMRLPHRDACLPHPWILERESRDAVGDGFEVIDRAARHYTLDQLVEPAVIQNATLRCAPYREIHLEWLRYRALMLENADQGMKAHRAQRD